MRTMTAKYNGRCRDCGADLRAGDKIRWSKATGSLCAAGECESDGHSDRMPCGCSDYHYADCPLVTSRYDDGGYEERYGGSDYARGRAEVAAIQAVSEAGSALREALYMEMEMNAYNRGED